MLEYELFRTRDLELRATADREREVRKALRTSRQAAKTARAARREERRSGHGAGGLSSDSGVSRRRLSGLRLFAR